MFKVGDRVKTIKVFRVPEGAEGTITGGPFDSHDCVIVRFDVAYTDNFGRNSFDWYVRQPNLVKVDDDTIYNYKPQFENFNTPPTDIHTCTPYVGVTHVEDCCVHCSRKLTTQEIQNYMKEKGL